MRGFGVTTIARWMMEPLPKRVVAYMENQGRLYRLKRIRSYNGNIQPILTAKNAFPSLGREFTSRGKYTLDSVVFLSMDVDLTGLTIEEILDAVAPACSDCWALQDKAMRDAALDKHHALQQQVAAAENDNWSRFFGSQFNPRQG